MKIKEIVSQDRRDFRAVCECEHCDHEFEGAGYDDAYFHEKVIPNMECPKCKKKASDSYRPLTTKYQEHEVV